MTTDDHRQPITHQIFDRQSVADQLQICRRPIANYSPIGRQLNFKSSLKFETNWRLVVTKSTIGRQPFGDRSPTNWCRHRWLWFTLSFLCIRGTKAWQIYAYQPETSVVSASLAVQGIIRIANEKSNCIISSFVILIILLTARLIKEVSMLCIKFSHPLFS